MEKFDVELTRRELYEKVWARPVTQVSAELGLSDRGLGKLCERHKIPVPPRGYWARFQHGYAAARPALPDPENADRRITVFVSASARNQGKVHADPEIQVEMAPDRRIVVQPDQRPRHPLVRAFASAARGALRDKYGRITPGRDVLAVHVTKAALPRVLPLLDALLTALDARGYAPRVEGGITCVTIQGERVHFALEERTRQVPRVSRRKGADPVWSYPRFDYLPTGELTLHIHNAYFGLRNRWRDGKRHKLEDVLNEFVTGLVLAGNRLRVASEERARREAIWAEERRQRELLEGRRQQLEQWSATWHDCQRYRAFLAAVREAMGKGLVAPELQEWLAWAEAYVEQLDPLTRAPAE